MKHFALLIAMALTCILAAVANVVVTRIITLNVFTFKLWFIIPIGAIGVGMLGASGAILAARYFNIQPTKLDALLMVFIAAATMLLIYYLDYVTLVLDDGRRATDLVDFGTYIDLTLTKAHMRVGRSGVDTGEVGDMGYSLAALEFFGFLVGGALTFFVIQDLWRCADCGAYLRRLKSKRSKELTIDEAANLLEHFQTGNLETVQAVMQWIPPPRTIPRKERKALLTFDLFHCPECKTEVIGAKAMTFTGQEWNEVPELTRRRNLSAGLSLRGHFD